MLPGRNALALTVATSVVVATLSLAPGCGSESVDFDAAANYTAETLAQELIQRYRALQPDAQKSKLGPRKKKTDRATAAKQTPSKKSSGRTTKKSGPATIDDVLEDIEHKITLVKGTSPADTTKKMIATISSDSSLSEADKKILTEHVNQLAD